MATKDERAAGVTLSRDFLRSFGQAVKLVSLYRLDHPVAASAMQQTLHALHALFDGTSWPEATFGLSAGRWLVNESLIDESAQAFELLSIVWRSHAIVSASFKPATRLYEFAALCELAATPPNRAYAVDAKDFLLERGVKNISVNLEEYVLKRRVRPPASALIESPLARLKAAARPRTAPSPAASVSATQGFGAFVKSLVEAAVQDPEERAKVYGEALALVQQALARHVSEETHRLLLEKQGAVNERVRADQVLQRVADGKVIVDQEGRVLMMDPAAEQLSGKALGEVAGKPILETLGGEDGVVSLAKDLVLPENRPVSGEVRTAGAEDLLEAMRRSLALVQDEQGRLVGTFVVPPHLIKLRETMRLQEQFIAGITHDLKAPLASICSALELIQEKLGGQLDGTEAEFLDIGLRNSRALRQMIDEILDFSKIQSGRMTIQASAISPAEVVEDAVRALRPWAASKRLTLEPAAVDALPQVKADRGRMVQVLTNLVSNAIKCTPEGGRVEVGAALDRRSSGTVVFRVSDTGCGIAPADQRRIFEKFSQLAAPGQRAEGVGLGLAIVKELVTRHGGEIWLESAPGKGSSFYFSIPTA